jgi:hypothetical protein
VKIQEVPFGDPWIYGSMRLPKAYRSLARPSSVLKPNHPPSSFDTQSILLVLSGIIGYKITSPFPINITLIGACFIGIHCITFNDINILIKK